MKHNLKPEVAKKLAAMLRSGKFRKAVGRLRNENDGRRPCMCVGGVLCDLYRKETGKGRWVRYRNGNWVFSLPDKFGPDPHSHIIPDAVEEWAVANAGVRCQLLNPRRNRLENLAKVNDDFVVTATFEYMAGLLES